MRARLPIHIALAAFALAGLTPRPVAAWSPVWGFRGGWSTARLHGSFGDEIGPDYRQDVTAGAYLRLPIRSAISFQPEMIWATKGGEADIRITFTPSGEPTEVFEVHLRHRLDYVELPLLLRFDIPTAGLVEPYLLAGPAPALRIGDGNTRMRITEVAAPAAAARGARTSAQIFEDVGTLDGDLSSESFDLGVVGGIGAWVGRGSVRLGIEARYTHSLLDVHPSDQVEMRNGAFAVTAAIEFR